MYDFCEITIIVTVVFLGELVHEFGEQRLKMLVYI